jgi:predicted RNase H-like nuclease (RuvC/YqgF family)
MSTPAPEMAYGDGAKYHDVAERLEAMAQWPATFSVGDVSRTMRECALSHRAIVANYETGIRLCKDTVATLKEKIAELQTHIKELERRNAELERRNAELTKKHNEAITQYSVICGMCDAIKAKLKGLE